MVALLVVGECGTGKSWVVQNVVEKLELTEQDKIGLIRYHANDKAVVAGIYNGELFQGSDKLSMAINTSLDDFLEFVGDRVLIVEGDRFMNKTFREKADPTVVRISGDGSEGREKRGSSQTERQLKSKATQVKNVVARAERVVEATSSAHCLDILENLIG